ncbi:hypothetical protein GCU60_09960 [Blastococcus saxobsidens]|uniref:Uncharacterized protein n=1 Tax=Blastococcus saxobsidens TaxID=138336 RepID=A0A6L9W3Q2_9ACTN|nr:hypothetical protein [Blastococcus saxobsidens]NEK86080.1 hypothetical protein [Blastococcus saxobsidens]
MDRRRAGLLAVLCLGLVGCTSDGAAPPPAAGSTAATGPDASDEPAAIEGPSRTLAGCDAEPIEPLEPFTVPAEGGTVTGLAFGEIPARVGDELKIIWRVTGAGDLAVRPVRPDGSEGDLVFGPEPHGGSNFSEPGDEWGTGFELDRSGCWRLELAREGVTATVELLVEEPPG